jgi:hypothetical protein
VKRGMDGTSHQMAMLSATAGIAAILQERAIEKEFHPGHDVEGLFLGRCYDGTPIDIVFGNLQEKLVPFARYLHKVGDELKLLSWDEYSKLGRAIPRRGTVELFAQSIELCYDDASGATHYREVIVPPMLLQNGGASCFYTGVEKASPALSNASFLLWNLTRFMLLHENPDNVSANVRKLHFTASVLPEFVLMVLGGCTAHRISRIGEILFEVADLCGDIYSLAFVSQVPSYFNRMQRACWQLICEDLLIIDGNVFPLDPRWKEFTMQVLKMTRARGLEFVRGQIDGAGEPFTEAPGLAKLEKVFETLSSILNGDIRSRRMVHIEVGCCPGGLAETRGKVFGALNTCNVLGARHSMLPRTDRIGSMTACNADQCAGFMIHGILNQTILKAFPTWNHGEPDPNEADEDDYRARLKKKVWRVVHTMDPAEISRRVVSNWLSVDPLLIQTSWTSRSERGWVYQLLP